MKYAIFLLLASCSSPIVQEAEYVITSPEAEKIEKELALEALEYAERKLGEKK